MYIDSVESKIYAGRWRSTDSWKRDRLVECSWVEDEKKLFCVQSPGRSFTKYRIVKGNLENGNLADELTQYGTYDGLDTITWNGGNYWKKQKCE